LHGAIVGKYPAEREACVGNGRHRILGQSFIAAPDGRVLYRAPVDEPCVLVTEVDLDETRSMRHGWPFFRDRRIDAYGEITERYLDGD
jgi:N-carbamoylputrescine amidase